MFFILNVLIFSSFIINSNYFTSAKNLRENNTETIFHYNFDDLADETIESITEYANYDNPGSISFPFKHKYLRTSDNRDGLVTDVTSITSPTSNTAICKIPFVFDQIENFFCISKQNDDTLTECDTGNSDFGDCNLGRFLIFKTFSLWEENITVFDSWVEFKLEINLESYVTYDVEINYLVNYDKNCKNEDIVLSVSLVDDEYFNKKILQTNNINVSIENNKWNKIDECFTVLGRKYRIRIRGQNDCENDKIFLIIDNIVIKKSQKTEEECLNLQVTEKPETKVSTLTSIGESSDKTTQLYKTTNDISQGSTEPFSSSTDETKITTEPSTFISVTSDGTTNSLTSTDASQGSTEPFSSSTDETKITTEPSTFMSVTYDGTINSLTSTDASQGSTEPFSSSTDETKITTEPSTFMSVTSDGTTNSLTSTDASQGSTEPFSSSKVNFIKESRKKFHTVVVPFIMTIFSIFPFLTGLIIILYDLYYKPCIYELKFIPSTEIRQFNRHF